MLRAIALLLVSLVVGCTPEDAGTLVPIGDCEFPLVASGPAVLPDDWRVTSEADAFIGAPPEESNCLGNNIGYRAEELDGARVFSVGTLYCDWITVAQPLRTGIPLGRTLRLRVSHGAMTAPFGSRAHLAVYLGDDQIWAGEYVIPQDRDVIEVQWRAPRSYPACTPVYFHVDNHGDNEYSVHVIELLDVEST